MHLYTDTLYGEQMLPLFPRLNVPNPLWQIAQTREAARARGISLLVTPNRFLWYGGIPSRFHHGMGVVRLALETLKANFFFSPPENMDIALPIAALVHDFGNPPFSHCGERFLKEITGKDGETFLGDILDGSETEKILHTLGLSIEIIAQWVTGSIGPVAEILHGSLDLDNLDNIARVNGAARCGAPPFDPIRIASAFRFHSDHWELDAQCLNECRKWQAAREIVYRQVYSHPHLAAAIMLFRALELAFKRNELTRDFFFLDDERALAYLVNRCNPKTAALIERLWRWQWFEDLPILETAHPSQRFRERASNWKTRCEIADIICQKLGIPEDRIAVYVGKGKEKRRIALPFVDQRSGETVYDESEEKQFYRAIVFVSLEYLGKRNAIADIVKDELL